jgi:hypothetical protein
MSKTKEEAIEIGRKQFPDADGFIPVRTQTDDKWIAFPAYSGERSAATNWSTSPDSEPQYCRKCGKCLLIKTRDGDINVAGISLGGGMIPSGDPKRDRATRRGLEAQFGKYPVDLYTFCIECSLKAIFQDSLPF